ncbi:hypothetical protein [Actinomadura formosensis]|uniref:hypothetical protein n=1 Tax=Actinomadura formosensis TaxID=60706 RepID=UPI003D8C3054
MIGRSGREWTIRAGQWRPGHLRPHDGTRPHQVDLVNDESGNTFGALRRFADRRERADALALLGIGGPAVPALLDLVDAAESPPAVITAWAPGRSKVPLDQLIEPDDLLAQLHAGRRWKPAAALRLLVPLGDALDRFAERGFVPLELSPDHLVENGGGIRLVGLGRHLYRPMEGRLPDAAGMSLPTTQMLCGAMPGPGSGRADWREAQVGMLLRLAGWMCGGLAPGSWGVIDGTGQDEYLRASGFASVPSLAAGRLAETLASAAAVERTAEAERRVRGASCVVLFDEAACKSSHETRDEWKQSLVGERLSASVIEVAKDKIRVEVAAGGAERWPFNVYWQNTPEGDRKGSRFVDLTASYSVGSTVTVVVSSIRPMSAKVVAGTGVRARARRSVPQVQVNPESVRLGLLEEHGPDVLAVAALPAHRQASAMAALLSGAGWLMLEPDRFGDVLATVRRLAPSARIVVAGRAGPRLAAALPSDYDEILPGRARGPRIAGRSADALPYLNDPDLNAYTAEVLNGQGGAAFRRRTFAPGWALALNEDTFKYRQGRAGKDQGRQLRTELDEITALYGADTELLLRIADMRARPGLRSENWHQMRVRLRDAASVLLGMPPSGALRKDLMHALLTRTTDNLHGDVTLRLLPVAPRLAQIYEPELRLGDLPLQELLYTREGVRRLGLLGRIATALPGYPVASLLDAVEPLEQPLVDALLDVPAPSLQFLVGRLGSDRLFEVLRPFIDGPDLDLLGQYTPTAWRLLLEGLRQPEHLTALGLGWALVVERDPGGTVDARALLEIARQAGVEARYAVRALLETPTAQWPRLLASPAASAGWLRAFGRLDLAPVLDAFPDVADLLPRFSAQVLRAAASAGLRTDLLETLERFAAGAGVAAGDVVAAFLNVGAMADDAPVFAAEAAAAWAAAELAAGVGLDDVLATLIEDPGRLRAWLVEGENLPREVLSGVLGAQPRSLGVGRTEGVALVALLEARPALLPLVRDLVFPSQRLRLLRLAADHPDWNLARQTVRDALPGLLDHPAPERILALMLGEDLTFAQARVALDRDLDDSGRALLRTLGPLAPDDDLFAVASRYGAAMARDVAILQQTRPGAAAAVRSWGDRWLPLLAGPSGAPIAALLARFPCPSPAVSAWLRAAGQDGLTELGRHGRALLDLVDQADPHPKDAMLLGDLLQVGGGPAAYRLIVQHGLPQRLWPEVAALSGRPAEDVLLALWSSDGWNPTPVTPQ